MQKVFGMNRLLLIIGLIFTGWLYGAFTEERRESDTAPKDTDNREVAPLVLQELDYTENPVDVPNPDRGFYRPSRYIVPVEAIDEEPGIPELGATIAGTSVYTDTRIVYMKFDLRNFSSNAPLNGIPLGP